MNFYNKIKPINLYFISVVSLVLSNFFRDGNQLIYVFLLTTGTILFILGFLKGRNGRK